MRVTFGVIFAQTGSSRLPSPSRKLPQRSRFSPIAAPILRSGNPCGQEKFSSKESTPASLVVVLFSDLRTKLRDKSGKHQNPNPKSQGNPKNQIPKTKRAISFELWSLELLWVLGPWDLVLEDS
jgi:hypothetical protein